MNIKPMNELRLCNIIKNGAQNKIFINCIYSAMPGFF